MDIVEILSLNFNDCMWSIDDNKYDTLVWDENNKIQKPTLEMLEELHLQSKYIVLRQKRDFLLAKSDKYATVDYPHQTPETKQDWFNYRQKLRDLPANTADPENPVWPEVPN